MGLRKLFAIMIAVAVLFAPAVTNAGSAYAAVPDHHAQMTEKGHCDPAKDMDQGEMADMACCGTMCMAVAVTAPAPQMVNPLIGRVPVVGMQEFQTGIPAEIATPPPRAA